MSRLSSRALLPSAASFPSTSPVTPLPLIELNPVALCTGRPFSRAALTIASAIGCSLLCSRLAAKASRVFSSVPSSARMASNVGLPSVRVPVLSTTRVSTFSNTSNVAASRMSTPACAPRPVPAMMDMGVAKPRAQGQAMISTLTALSTAKPARGSGPHMAHTMAESTAMHTTAGTK